MALFGQNASVAVFATVFWRIRVQKLANMHASCIPLNNLALNSAITVISLEQSGESSSAAVSNGQSSSETLASTTKPLVHMSPTELWFLERDRVLNVCSWHPFC